MESTEYDDDNSKVQAFLNWFTQHDGTSLSAKVQLKDILDAGHGLVATQPILEDEELFRIPRGFILDSQTSKLRQHMADKLDALDPWLSLILVLIYETLQGDKSVWAPYLKLLPDRFDALMFWSEHELAQLQASAIVTNIGKQDAEARFMSELLPIIQSNPQLFLLDQNTLAEEVIRRAHIAGSCVMAYAFDVDKDDDHKDDESLVTDDEENPAKGMIPFADMLNADAARNNAHLTEEDDCFIMKSIKPISASEEIFNDYGNLPRSDLLRRYGYVADSYRPFDIVEVSLALITGVAKSQGLTKAAVNKAVSRSIQLLPCVFADPEKFAPLDQIGVLDDGYAIGRSESEDLQELLPSELLLVIIAICKEGSLNGGHGTTNARNDRLGMSEVSFLHTLIVNRIAEYSTSLEDDYQLLSETTTNTVPGSTSLLKRHLMALQVRIGEKEILDHIRQVSEEWIKTRTEEIVDQGKKRKFSGIVNGQDNGEKGKAQRT